MHRVGGPGGRRLVESAAREPENDQPVQIFLFQPEVVVRRPV